MVWRISFAHEMNVFQKARAAELGVLHGKG
jgi:hypothetical protein